MNPHVFVTRAIPDAGLELLRESCELDVWPGNLPPSYETMLERVAGAQGILSLVTDQIDGPLMDAAGDSLKVISQMAVGVDNIDLAAAAARGLAVGHTPGVLTEATADLAFTLLLAAARRLVEGVEYIRAGNWQTWGPTTLLGMELSGATLGIIGFGRIGQAVAKRAAGFGMRILAHSPRLTPEEAAEFNAIPVLLDSLLRKSDIVSLHVPLTDRTRHLIDEKALAKMKPDAILINTARGPIVDQHALYDALRDGVIGAAALDVTDPEPMSRNDPLLTLPNAIVLPHIGSATVKTRDRMATMAAQNLLAGLRGDPLPNAVSL